MESIAFYLLKSAAWLVGFTLVYLLFLRKERFFRLKRAYLVAGVLISLLLPLLTIHYRVEMPAPVVQEAQAGTVAQTQEPAAVPVQHDQKSPFNILLLVYVGGVALFLFRALIHFFSLYHALRTGSVSRTGDAVMVKTEKYTSAFSFFNYVFINPSVSEQEAREILNHEMVHLKQKHWFDLLLIEMMSLIQWMNPFVWIYSALIRQNHENLADEEALQSTSDPAGYRAALLNQVFNARLISLSNSFNFSFYTNRFEMMKKKTYSPYRKLRLLLVLPIMAGMLFAFASPMYVYAENEGTSELTVSQQAPLVQNSVKGVVYREDGTPFPGVNVKVSGTSLSMNTDASGRFEFKGIPEVVTMVFTNKGYNTLLLNPVLDKEMTVKMNPDANYVDPVAVKTDASGKQKLQQLVVVDGIITDQALSEVIEKMGSDFVMAKSLTPDEAMGKYGEKGAGGAMEIYSREKADEMNKESDRVTFVVVENMPAYPGGDAALFKFIYENVRYPPEAKEQGIQGKVIVRFAVTSVGAVEDVTIVRGVHPLLDAEALRVMSLLPEWKPGTQGGKAVNVWYSVPIAFSLSSGEETQK